ncbi:MAG: hypothetical protein VKK04_02790, partial [Synechococcales bacterium]|nr:hypothetical protein [Synechococcales bacterium]
GGQFGQVVLYDYDYCVGIKVAASIQALYSSFADDLEAGRYSLLKDKPGEETDYDWLEPERELDVVNWSQTERWQYVNDQLFG